MILQKYGTGCDDAAARGKEGIAQDAEDPAFEVSVRLKRVESAECFRECFLHEVFSLRVIASEPERVIVERRQKRQRKLFKISAARGRHHVIKCLAMTGTTELDRRAEQCFTSEHHPPKPDYRQIIPRIILGVPRNKSRQGQFSDAEVVTMKGEIGMKH